jgi:hypothetical protein
MSADWIPCAERLPEMNVDVLVFLPGSDDMMVSWRAPVYGGSGIWLWNFEDDDLEPSYVSHWMPLPERPAP